MSGQNLMPAFVGDHRFERVIFRVGIAIKRLRIDRQQIRFWRTAAAILGASSLAVNVPVLDASDKPQLLGDASGSMAAGALSARSQRPRLRGRHQEIIPTWGGYSECPG